MGYNLNGKLPNHVPELTGLAIASYKEPFSLNYKRILVDANLASNSCLMGVEDCSLDSQPRDHLPTVRISFRAQQRMIISIRFSNER